jgi:uncharacterized protein YchJ
MTTTLPTPPAHTPALLAQADLEERAIVYAHYILGADHYLITGWNPASHTMTGWITINDLVSGFGVLSHRELDDERIHGTFRARMADNWEPCTVTEAKQRVSDQLAGYTTGGAR